jgi:hypothetical protein
MIGIQKMETTVIVFAERGSTLLLNVGCYLLIDMT